MVTPVVVVLDTHYTDDLLGLTFQLTPTEVADTKEILTIVKADELSEDWMKHSVLFYTYIFDGVPPLTETGDCTFHHGNTMGGQLSFVARWKIDRHHDQSFQKCVLGRIERPDRNFKFMATSLVLQRVTCIT